MRRGRVHDLYGRARRRAALALAAMASGPIVWILERPPHARAERLCPTGIARILDPGRLIVAAAGDAAEALWAFEEALRAGAAPMVVAELERPTALTPSRRLQLAAEAGGALGVALTPAPAKTNAAETRWRAEPIRAPAESGGRARLALALEKNKRGSVGAWEADWDDATRRFVVAAAGRGRARAAA